MEKGKILIVDDEKNIRFALKMVLEGEGYKVSEAPNAEFALEILDSKDIDLVLLDLKMKKISGADALKLIKSKPVSPEVIVISGQATTEEALETVRNGAFDFLEKPLDRSRILVTVQNALEYRNVSDERDKLTSQLSSRYSIIGKSEVMLELFRKIEKIAPTKGRVLILGESGTGKELVARAIHKHSNLSDKPFIKVNCAAIPPELIESELFGHEKGAFTGATHLKRGLFEQADGGTVFLDEIGDMSLSAQAKVLRVLQSGEFTRVGGEKSIFVDVRVIAATNKNLEEMVKNEIFREDLYFRLSVLPIYVPPLRERSEDIPLLVEGFISLFCREYGFKIKKIEPKVIEVLQSYSWPGNVRELKNMVERIVILSGDHIGIKDLPFEISKKYIPEFKLENFSHLTLKEFRQLMERNFIKMKLNETSWNITKAAKLLDIERTNLHKKIKLYNLEKYN